ncbi:MAG: hypothetical protein IKH04_04200 [Kiritimatiellae bacterium]|nr:hypothetical protein [Kiritimatiellia bacterium]
MKTTHTIAFAATLAAYALAASAAQYSKLGIVSAVKRLGRIDAMNAWIKQAGYWDEWLACQVFADDYPGFDAITNAAVASGLCSAAEADAILAESRIEKSGPAEIDALLLLVENDKALREKFHGGRIGQYVVTNESGRLIRVDLYADGGCWTNGLAEAARALKDPEAEAKRLAALAEERERVQAAWEAANLPPDLAALRARQREVERQNAAAEAD